MQLQRNRKAGADYTSPSRVAVHGPGPEELMQRGQLEEALEDQSGCL